jgi:hypothetical protein
MIPEPRRRVLPWCAAAIGGLMVASHVYSFGVARASAREAHAGIDPTPVLAAVFTPTHDGRVMAAMTVVRDSAPSVSPDDEPTSRSTARPRPRLPDPPPPLTAREARLARQAERGLRDAVQSASVVVSPMVFARPVELDGTSWDEAVVACRELVVDGVGGWRLPTRREAGELRGRLPADVVWTKTTSGRDPEAAWVYDLERRRAAVWLKLEPTASTVCVQPRPRRTQGSMTAR